MTRELFEPVWRVILSTHRTEPVGPVGQFLIVLVCLGIGGVIAAGDEQDTKRNLLQRGLTITGFSLVFGLIPLGMAVALCERYRKATERRNSKTRHIELVTHDVRSSLEGMPGEGSNYAQTCSPDCARLVSFGATGHFTVSPLTFVAPWKMPGEGSEPSISACPRYEG